MSFQKEPTQMFAGMSEDGTDITLPLAAVPQITATEADAVGGDLRKVAYGLCHQMHAHIDGLDEADKPSKFRVNEIRSAAQVKYEFTFDLTPSQYEVADEPA